MSQRTVSVVVAAVSGGCQKVQVNSAYRNQWPSNVVSRPLRGNGRATRAGG